MRQTHSNLKSVLQLPDLPADYRPLKEPEFFAEGTGNSHWLITSPVGKLVWRQFGSAPGANHQHEIQLLTSLQNKPWVPHLLLAVDNLGLLMCLAEGKHPIAATLTTHQRQSLIQLAIQLWQTPFQGKSFPTTNYPQLLENYWQLAGKNPATLPLLTQLIKETQHWPSSSFRLTHHDLHGGNLLLNKKALNTHHWTLLDWEYAGLGNPWIDAVSLDRFMSLTADEKAQLEAVLPALANSYLNDKKLAWKEIGQWLADLDLLWKSAKDA